MDFDDFEADFKDVDFNIIELNAQKALLNAKDYSDNIETIGLFKSLLLK